MKMLIFTGFYLMCALSICAPSSWAGRSKIIKQPQETYPAFEPGTEEAAPRLSTSQKNSTRPSPAPASVNEKKEGFELVPANQAEPIIHRLKIVEELIRKHGRAYDYRMHTIKELQSILSQLDSTRSLQLPEPPQSTHSSQEPPAGAKESSPAFSPDISSESL